VDRRTFLALAVPAAAAITSLSAHAAEPTIEVNPLTDQLALLSGGGGNVVLFNSPQGVLLVDGGSPEQSARVLATVRRHTGAAGVHTLFNTHWHWDQTGSNQTLGASGTQIIAHENTRLWLGTDAEVKWQRRIYPRLPAQARPNKTFYTTGRLDFGGEQIDYGYLPQAHTDGDLYVHFRAANVIVAGDVLSIGRYPIIDYSTGGWIGGLAEATRQLLQLGNEQTRYIAGTGRVLTRTDVQAERDMLVAVQSRLAKLLAQGMSVTDMLAAAPTRDLDASWGDPSLLIANAWPGLVARARELGVSIV
jgi:glyoxylase-like metal-dependent hydrolase (beta-lactamase superfamily II)